ncbi:undecaprenyl-phosphate glucose phosphotransferase [Rhodoferax sp. U11-2br]|uniref:undecaprenyl-phosphate glucose phosphotransferase n=1 Tax=Rhodoferax sp. U11-2br TaxID=2838878 RepID=UPI001BE5C9C6|nr:undecaprenyl-phosphate glucose phosphotransferase [Rhodoferax sp. U11-2br]MBT3068511.1 undecaprenyl-phosphate glucose phosphotransferase [Rhodoferax sp. U11-2br]
MNTATAPAYKRLASPAHLSRRIYSLVNLVEAVVPPLLAVLVLFVTALAGDPSLRSLDPAYFILALAVFSLSFPGCFHLNRPVRVMLRKTLIGWFFLATLLLLFAYGADYLDYFPRPVMLAWLSLTPLALVGVNTLARIVVPSVLALERNRRYAVIVGCNATSQRLAQSFADEPALGVNFLGYFDDRNGSRLQEDDRGRDRDKDLGSLGQLVAYAKANRVDQIYLALPIGEASRLHTLLDDLKDTTASIFFVPDMFVTDLIQGRVDSVGGTAIVAMCETPFKGINGVVKRLSDIVLASVILVLITPILLIVAIGVKLMSPGPAFFKQNRYGLDGREIVVYKFRSMTVTEDGDRHYTQVTRGDPRVPPFGALIRKGSLDELPQFINVLQGRMSIVGPRPHAIAVNEQYRKLIPGYMVRHKVRPGITGWAQVNGFRGGDDLEHMRGRSECDLEYLRNWSLGLDLRIILRTIILVFRDVRAF